MYNIWTGGHVSYVLPAGCEGAPGPPGDARFVSIKGARGPDGPPGIKGVSGPRGQNHHQRPLSGCRVTPEVGQLLGLGLVLHSGTLSTLPSHLETALKDLNLLLFYMTLIPLAEPQ